MTADVVFAALVVFWFLAVIVSIHHVERACALWSTPRILPSAWIVKTLRRRSR